MELKIFFLFVGDVAHQGASDLTCEMTCVDQVDFGPSDLDQTHVTNVQPKICKKMFRNCPLHLESTTEKKLEKYTTIK